LKESNPPLHILKPSTLSQALNLVENDVQRMGLAGRRTRQEMRVAIPLHHAVHAIHHLLALRPTPDFVDRGCSKIPDSIGVQEVPLTAKEQVTVRTDFRKQVVREALGIRSRTTQRLSTERQTENLNACAG
jgi:hypothetical protein